LHNREKNKNKIYASCNSKEDAGAAIKVLPVAICEYAGILLSHFTLYVTSNVEILSDNFFIIQFFFQICFSFHNDHTLNQSLKRQ